MNRIKDFSPWQIIGMAIGVLILAAVGSYLLVTHLTSSGSPKKAESTVPGDLGGGRNKQTLERLGVFTEPRDLPIVTGPVATPDPNQPQFPNVFSP